MYEYFIFCCNALHLTRTVKQVITRHSAIPPKFDFSDMPALLLRANRLPSPIFHGGGG